MKYKYMLLALLFSGMQLLVNAQDSIYSETWALDNLELIGGHILSYTGNPQIVSTDEGDVVEFDGDGDRLLINANPIGEAKEFTVELVFWPDTYVDANKDPRFVHIQDPDDPQEKRVMIELRVNEQNQCYMDGFIKTDKESLALIDDTKTHPTEQWLHTAITYKDGVFKTYMEGREELSGALGYDNLILGTNGKTSLGARMDERNYFKGKMKTLKVTRKALDPSEFLINDTIDTTTVSQALSGNGIPGLEVYPVPADKHLRIVTGEMSMDCQVEIVNILGKNMFSGNIVKGNRGEILVDTGNFQPGFYIVQLQSETYYSSRSILVMH